MLEQQRPDPAALVGISDLERDLGDRRRRVREQEEPAEAEDLFVVAVPDRHRERDLVVVRAVDPLQIGRGELALRTEEPVTDRALAHPGEQGTDAVVIIGAHATDHDGSAVTEDGVLGI